jgi:branched-chain amino acid transport system ATP-binding protein
VNLLTVKGLTAGYGPVRVVHGIDFTIEQGAAAVILGANGAGKTTTLRALTGIIPAKGHIELDGHNLSGRSTEDIARLGVAHVPEGRGTVTNLTVEENLRLGAFVRRDKAGVETDIARCFDWFPLLSERRQQAAGKLSGGEQQMLAVARGLMLRPRLLLLDEPSLGLAPIVTREVFRILGDINHQIGTTMLVVEQNANLALDFADFAYVLEAGQIVLRDEASTVKANDSVRRAYLGY